MTENPTLTLSINAQEARRILENRLNRARSEFIGFARDEFQVEPSETRLMDLIKGAEDVLDAFLEYQRFTNRDLNRQTDVTATFANEDPP